MQIELQIDIPPTALFRGDAQRIVVDEIMAATEFGVNLFQQTVLPLTPVDRGMLRGGIQTKVSSEGVGTDITGRVFNTLGYALAVEEGSKPHFPPVAPLEAWAERKLGKAGLGFVIARAIARRGTQAVLMFKRGFDAARPRVEARFNEAVARIVSRLTWG